MAKKSRKAEKLSLKRETLRRLTQSVNKDQLKAIAGGFMGEPTGPCSTTEIRTA